MAFFDTKKFKFIPRPVPDVPSYTPPIVPTPTPTGEGSTPVINVPTFSGDTNIILYVTQDERNKINKTLGNNLPFDISIKENTSVINPTLILDSDTDLSYYNYMYIASVQRYYFIDNVEMVQGGHFKIYATCDVLMSFKNDILNITGIVDETNTDRLKNLDLDNRHFVNSSGKNIKIKRFPNHGFLITPKNILVTCGKESN